MGEHGHSCGRWSLPVPASARPYASACLSGRTGLWHPWSRSSCPRWRRQAIRTWSTWRSGCSAPGTQTWHARSPTRFGLQRGRANVLDGEPALLRTLVEHPDPDGIVPAAALGAVRYLAAQHRDLAVELLTRVPDSQKRTALDEFALAFGPHGALAWNDLAQRHKEALPRQRCAPRHRSKAYEITEFLAMLSLA